MDRALYPDSVEVDNSALGYTESTKIDQILDRTLAIAQVGILSGLVVSVNTTNNQLVDVSSGQTFVVNGELAVLSADQIGIPLADNTNGIVNYVIINYVETDTTPEPSEDGLNIEYTLVESAGVVSILTQAQYNALLPSDQQNMEVIASIVATGGAISPSLITQSSSFSNVLAPSQPSTITGVTIIHIDSTTPTGTGTLDFDASPPNSSDPSIPAPRIRWQSPGDGVPGTYVNIPSNGVYSLVANSGHTLTIQVISVTLPLIDVTEPIQVVSLYTQPIVRTTAADYLHRTYVGSGTPSTSNPHGLTFADLGGSPNQQVEAHQLLMHSNGIRKGSNSVFLYTSVIPVSGPSPDYIAITGPISGDTYYVNGVELLSITNNQITFLTSISFSRSLYDLFVDSAGTPGRALRVEHPVAPTVNGVVVIDLSDNIGAGNYDLTYDSAARTLTWGSGPPVLVRANGNYTLYDDAGNYVTLNVGVTTDLGYGTLPITGGPIYIDSIQVFAIVDRKIYFELGYVPWDGSDLLGWTVALTNPRQTMDKRLFGTMGLPDLRDDALDQSSDHAPDIYSVGDGKVSFGDFNGPVGIQAALNALASAGVSGLVSVKSGTYDPFLVAVDNVEIHSSGAIIDGVSNTVTPGACISVQANNVTLAGFTVQNAGIGILQLLGNDCQGTDIIFGSGLTLPTSWVAGARNRYTGSLRQRKLLTANATLTPFDQLVLVNASAGAITLNLPLSTNCANNLTIKKIDTTVNAVTVVASPGTDTIDYAPSDAVDVYLNTISIEPTAADGWIGV